MSQETLRLLLTAGQFLLSCGIGVWLYFDRRNDRTNERLGQLSEGMDKRLDDHAARISALEAMQKSAVTHADLGRITSEVAATKSLLQSVKEQLDRIQTYLLNSK